MQSIGGLIACQILHVKFSLTTIDSFVLGFFRFKRNGLFLV